MHLMDTPMTKPSPPESTRGLETGIQRFTSKAYGIAQLTVRGVSAAQAKRTEFLRSDTSQTSFAYIV